MSELQQALEVLRPKEFGDVPLDNLSRYVSDIFSKAELVANSVPPPPGGTPYESSQRSRSDANGAINAASMTLSDARRPAPSDEQEKIQQAWGKPLKLGGKDAATGINVFKMAGHDRHGAWFARTSVHEGLGFTKWKRAMMEEFPESLEVQGGPGVGNVRGIGGDQRLEDISVDGLGKMEVFQLSAQFPGPTAPREFITLLLTSSSALSKDSQIGDLKPRHYIVVSIPVSHPNAPARQGMVRGQYESVEMIREIPLPSSSTSTAGSDHGITADETRKTASPPGTISRIAEMDRDQEAAEVDPETNPVEWIMVTRSDPGGGIPRFMVERGTPASIVQDAGKFLDWACAKEEFSERKETQTEESEQKTTSTDHARYSVFESNGLSAGIGTSIADRPTSGSIRRASQRAIEKKDEPPSLLQPVADGLAPYVPTSLLPLQRTDSNGSVSTRSTGGSFASADQFQTAPDGLQTNDEVPTLSSASDQSISQRQLDLGNNQSNPELQKIDLKRQQLKDRFAQQREQQLQEAENAKSRSAKELEKAQDRHERDKKKQEERFEKEVKKLDERRKRETEKLLARQRKEEDKNFLQKANRERDEWKQRAELAEEENKLILAQIRDLQKENTALVVQLGKIEGGKGILESIRRRAGSSASTESSRSRASGKRKESGDGKGDGKSPAS